ncbi:MAG: TolC family protein, partial [Planctomycetales bacterium]
MTWGYRCIILPWMFTLLALAGCQGSKGSIFHDSGAARKGGSRSIPTRRSALEIEYPDVKTHTRMEALSTLPPRTLSEDRPPQYCELTLEESIQKALLYSKTARDLGGRILANPSSVASIYQPAIRESDPRFGTEAALSAFDANMSTSLFWEKQDRQVNIAFGAANRTDLHNFQSEISKTAATGTQFFVRNITDYEQSDSPLTIFESAWDTRFETEFRHPLLQGGGVEFNRIAGPSATPGFFFSNGVLIARMNTDVALADFELGIRNLVSDVENAYWELYFAYRDLDAKKKARATSLKTWQNTHAAFLAEQEGGEAHREAQARQQYYLFHAQVQASLTGIQTRGTINNQGSTGGTPQMTGGVYSSERRLRLLLGLPITDEFLLRPADEPAAAKVRFDWSEILPESLVRRVEIRRQKILVKRRELELIASRNFLLPRFDVVGLYRWRGFGDHLAGRDRSSGSPSTLGMRDNALSSLTSGEFQEWQMGLQFDMPIGFRQGHAGVRNAQLWLAREKAVLQDQELTVAHDLSQSVAELDRAFHVAQTHLNRVIASKQQF